ncbi:MAG: tetratricopeptide repeat protein [Gemmatimonadetes bacterium]|nr:tetratricopeptide repeat protein [Gemmatimonadota bacterium]
MQRRPVLPRITPLALAILLAGPRAGRAQAESRALAEAGELERVGRHADAAVRYRGILRADPTSLPALLGLERVFTSLGRPDSLVPLVRAALARDPLNQAIHSLELRVWFALGHSDSVTSAARRWIALAPRSADPYREWAFTVAQRGDLAGAKGVLSEGAGRLGDAALAQDLAQLTALAGEWTEAARQWVTVVRGNPALLPAATGSLTRAPAVARDEMLSVLLGVGGDSTSRRLAADLLAGWGRADEAWPLLDATLPRDPQAAAVLLQRFAERAATMRSRRSALVRGYALERLATLVDAAASERVRLQAAQAYADAGDLGSAQRMLERAGAGAETGEAVAPAMASLIRALAEQGSVEEAERRLRAWSDRLSGDDRETLREAVAWAWARRGELDRAEAVLAPDSSVAAAAVRGWIALYRGDLGNAREQLRAAGPYTGSREEATRRMGMLVLVERIATDRLPEFGRAVLALARGDSVQALVDLEQAARKLSPSGGRADVLAFAGEQALARRDYQAAEDLLSRALATDSVGPAAPAAELALARVQAETGRTEVAIRQLEHLILAHPQSAMVPQARRLRDRLRGVVPE